MIDKTPRQFLKTRTAMLAIVFMIAACALAIVVQLSPWRTSFNVVAWHDQLLDELDRQEMADDLIVRSLLDGFTRSEVTALLGPPTDTDYFRDWDLVYWLGRERGYISIDSEWLVVRFGENDRVSDYRIVRD